MAQRVNSLSITCDNPYGVLTTNVYDDTPKITTTTTTGFIDLENLTLYDKKIKEYIDKRIDQKLSEQNNTNKYKIITGESD